jgi:hypothetical protein
MLLQKLAHYFQGGVLVSLRLDQHIEDLAFGVDGPPEIDHTSVDFQIDLVQMPSRMASDDALAGSAAIIGPKWFTQRGTVS